MGKMYRVAKKAQKELITRAMLGGGGGMVGKKSRGRGDEFRRDGGGEGRGCVAVFKGKRRGGCSRWKGGEAREGKIKALEMISLRHATRLLR